jgi:hypothetical protein
VNPQETTNGICMEPLEDILFEFFFGDKDR